MASQAGDLRYFGDDRTPRSFGEPDNSWQLAKVGGHSKQHNQPTRAKTSTT
jgi:hypothetical protein